jgi:hypothetical protein
MKRRKLVAVLSKYSLHESKTYILRIHKTVPIYHLEVKTSFFQTRSAGGSKIPLLLRKEEEEEM